MREVDELKESIFDNVIKKFIIFYVIFKID